MRRLGAVTSWLISAILGANAVFFVSLALSPSRRDAGAATYWILAVSVFFGAYVFLVVGLRLFRNQPLGVYELCLALALATIPWVYYDWLAYLSIAPALFLLAHYLRHAHVTR